MRKRFWDYLLGVLGCLLITQQAFANDVLYEHQRDSLLHAISVQTGEKQLKSRKELLYLAGIHGASTDVLRNYYEQGKEAALAQENEIWESMLTQYLVFLYNKGEYSELFKVGEEEIKRMPKGDNYFKASYLFILSSDVKYTSMQQIEAANELYEEAQQIHSDYGICESLQLIAVCYKENMNYKQALKCYRELLEYASKSDKMIDFQIVAYYAICGVLIDDLKRPDEVDALLPKWEQALKRFEAIRGMMEPNACFAFYKTKVARYITQGHYDVAMKYIQQYTTLMPFAPVAQYYFYLDSGLVVEGLKKYDEALKYIDQAYKMIDPKEYYDNITLLSHRLRILSKMGGHDHELYSISQHILALKDSLIQESNEKQLNKLRMQYNVDKLTYEKRLAQKRMVFFFCFSVFLLSIISLLIYYNRRISRKDRAMYNRLQDYDRIKQQYVTAEATPSDPDNPQQQLVNRLDEYLRTDRHYATLTNMEDGEMLVTLQTNRTYLREAVKNITGKTLSEYVHDLQLEEARHLLDNRPELTIDSIAMECGFSARTFTRLFQSKYDISPSQYRKMKVR
ncbi:MAG: helix-turn-helix domain-containing protein [Mediterranea sp.]|jgi:AraC-like DNA-binding protein|nr:helix-turn-helix domain-containing protein [Mediterranea sp.]